MSTNEHQLKVRTSDEFDPSIPKILPHDKVYSIQVGYKLFRLSGASLSSDAPSYFTKFFVDEENTDQILFIDRNPLIFEKIYNHLQGYHINVENDFEFVHIWLDSYYFGLRRLQSLLSSEDIFCTIGNQSFKISKDLLINSGNYPNYFLINYDSQLTDNLAIIEAKNILRPPPQKPATVANRSPLLFSDLLEILRGNPLVIRDDEHRNILIRECRYYRFLELEQRIIKHKVVNSTTFRGQEILINLNDIQPKGLVKLSESPEVELPLTYSRPLIKEPARILTFQINNTEPFDPSIKLMLNKTEKFTIIQLTGKIRNKFLQTFKSISSDYKNEPLDSKKSICLVGLKDCKAKINGIDLQPDWFLKLLGVDEITNSLDFTLPKEPLSKKRKLAEDDEPKGSSTPDKDLETDKSSNGSKDTTKTPEQDDKASNGSKETTKTPEKGDIIEIKLTKALYRVMLRGDHARLHAVSIEGVTDERKFFQDSLEFL